VAAGKTDGEALIRAVEKLCAELGQPEAGADLPGARSRLEAVDRDLIWGSLRPEEEWLVLEVRAGLARIVAALWVAPPEGLAGRAVGLALDGAEVVMRGEISKGNLDALPEMIPSFVYLVAVQVAGGEEALRLSQRAAELIEETRGR
jgi:hypothetical protein